MHDQGIIVRFDGIQEGLGMADNLCFTVMSHFIGADGRDYFRTSWIGVTGLLRAGMDIERVRVVLC